MSTEIEAVEEAKFEVVQADMFSQFIGRENKTMVLKFEEETPFEVWEAYTKGILELGRRSQRDIGQCLLFGERKYGEKFAQVIDAMRYSPKTIQNAVIVVKNISKWHDALSFAHHDVVCTLKADEQDEMLTMAEKEELTVSQLRKAKNEKFPEKKKKGGKESGKDGTTPQPLIDLTNEAEVLQAGHLLIAFLEKAEADLPFREWPKARVDKWRPILTTLTKIARRSVIKTH